MPITRTPQVDDDGSGTTGTIWNNAWKQELYGQIDALTTGAWTGVPFDAANFTASAGSWTVTAPNQVFYQWAVVNQHVALVAFVISGTMTITAAATSLFLTLPSPIPTPSLGINTPFTYYGGGANGTGYLEAQTTGKLRLLRDPGGTPFAAFTAAFGQFSGIAIYSC